MDEKKHTDDAAPLPVVQPGGEGLTLERYVRTAVQVALTSYDDRLDTCAGPAAEDCAIERAAALLTPAARLALAAELLEPLGLATISILSPPAFDELVAGHEQSICERLEGQTYVRSGLVQLGKVQVHLYSGRPATLDDARRLLEGEG